ncbi:preprotein translocase subunit TatC [Lysobacteraceae bacterium NML75-0749]|nr:preprotein translocase subunit TatC [Xanthomonadaceae bacterium NML75-0749]PJJ99928.1 preprotein translocase subunit TatC [Xanthomonadaceae bacterium NML03-0222]PJK05951.1 preprotein translocase subunit TatC [Xanthomonadaceae bacterium NML91-0268]PJK06379.1 preprotein translocase subunit TatC [Xanthomonadaceae bacterium NML95-0200]PJK06635.1 preprotein translocase subunit TatC [Xanthomonadaceae bacterium NML71-0210]PJK15223.1 preprotein translocase subunit TatC [Xanthomonadaceae bacterium N
MRERDNPAGLVRDDIVRLVDVFYDRVQADAVIGPIFNDAVHDWPAHKAMLVRFWSSVALGTREYRGNPMAVHRAWPIIDAHFGHWLALWQQTAQQELGEAKADVLYQHARRIAQSLRYGLGLDRTRPLPVLLG